MKKTGKKMRKTVFAFLLAFITAMSMSAAVFADEESLKDKGVLDYNQAYDYEIVTGGADAVGASGKISSGWSSLGSSMSYMKFPAELVQEGDPDGVWCYCIDITTSTENHHNYSLTTLEAAEYYEDEVSAKIRAILVNSWPHLSVAELQEKYGLTDLTEEEAFMATQWVVWYYSNPDGDVEYRDGIYYPADLYKPSEFSRNGITIYYDDENGNEVSLYSTNVVKLAKALDALEPADAYDTEPVVIKYEQRIYSDKVVFDMKDTVNLEALEAGAVTVKDTDGKILPYTFDGTKIIIDRDELTFEGDTANIVLEVSGVQTLSEDAYFFSPEGGREASQSRVAVCSGLAPVMSIQSYALLKSDFDEAEDDAELKVTKSVLLNGEAHRSDAVFYAALFEDKECTQLAENGDVQAIEMNGEAAASVVFHELVPGKTYYVAETDADGKVLKDGDCGIETIAYDRQEATVSSEELKEVVITNCYVEDEKNNDENKNDEQGGVTGGDEGDQDKDKEYNDKKDTDKKADSNVRTGDNITYVIIAAAMLLAAAATAIALLAGRKKRS